MTMLSHDTKSELKDTAVIGGLGMAAGAGVGKLLGKIPAFKRSSTMMGAAVGASGILADYAGVKLNKARNSGAFDKKAELVNKEINGDKMSLTLEQETLALLKQAGVSEQDAQIMYAQYVMEKTATDALVMSGIDVERAAKMVKAANFDVRTLTQPKAEVAIEKTAAAAAPSGPTQEELLAQISELREQLEGMTKAAEEAAAEPALPAGIVKAAEAGVFDQDELVQLRTLTPDVLEKIAASMETPADFGHASSNPGSTTDPLLAFLLS